MASRPTDVSNFGEAVYDQLSPVADLDSENGWALLIYVAALAEMFKLMDDLAHSDPPWSLMLDPDNCPVEGLPWMGQLVGVSVNTNLTEVDQRNQIKNHLGWDRGKITALENVVKPYLSGTKKVVIKERDTSPYHFTLNTYATETPADLTLQDLYNGYATMQAFYLAFASFQAYWLTGQRNQIQFLLNVEKPASLQYTYTVLPGSPP